MFRFRPLKARSKRSTVGRCVPRLGFPSYNPYSFFFSRAIARRMGDTLAEIVARYGVTVDDLVPLNRDR